MTVVSAQTAHALILTPSNPVSSTVSADLASALLGAAPPRLVVLDLRDVEVLTVRTARAVVGFAQVTAGPGVRCVVLAAPTAGVRVVLDTVDPGCVVQRATTLEQALRGPPAGPAAPTEPGAAAKGPATAARTACEQVVEITDVEAAERFFNANYARIRLHSRDRGSGGGMRISSAELGPVRLDRMDFRFGFDAEVAPLHRYAFAQVTAGSATYSSHGPERHYQAGDVYLPAQPDAPFRGVVEVGSTSVALLHPSTIDQVAQTAPGPQRAVLFTGYDAVSAPAAHAWASTVAHLADNLSANPEAMAHPLVAGNAARLLAATALATFPNTALTNPTIEDRHDAHPHTLRRAIAYIEVNADRDISVGDIAKAAYVTVRAVQLAFRRHLDTTPVAYLRRVRLDSAHADLLAATPGEDTVTEIAARWGYGRASVFAARYRAIYGEPPSRTLREQ